MITNKRKVFLLSAGAALDWHNGPSTKKITEEILKIGFKNKKGERITKSIFDKLNRGKEPDYQKANFETIVNVIEDFIGYWSKNESNLLSIFISDDHIDWDDYIGNFDIINRKNGYDLIVEGASESIHSRMTFISNLKNPKVLYFEILLMEIFDSINSIIDKYSNTYKKAGIYSSKNDEVNNIVKYYIKLISKHTLRVYSTNYDKIIETLLKDLKIDFTDGFQDLPHAIPQTMKHLVPHGIYLTKNETRNCIYHLHGSAYWRVVPEDENGLDYYSFVSSEYCEFPFNNGIPSFAIEKGNSIPIFNIITGYRKVSRTGLSPFRQFFAAFDRDCYKANELTIVGYSFGDEHINDIINKARHSNKELKIEIVDPKFEYKNFGMDHIPRWGHIGEFIVPEKISENIILYKQIGLTTYNMTFKEYLQTKLDESQRTPNS